MEMHFTCCGNHCLKTISMLLEEDDLYSEQRLGFIVREKGWVLLEPEFDNDDKPHFMAACSVHCHNERFKAESLAEPRLRNTWWTSIHKFTGEPPPCTCTELTREDGLLIEVRSPRCPWHIWNAGWCAGRNDLARKLFERWSRVKPGTLVEQFDQWRATEPMVRRGRVSGKAKLIESTFGGFVYAVIPVEDWRPLPHLDELVIVAEGDA